MSGTLFLVATPIGNLEDVTLRALRVLREADLVAAEDTRRTGILLAHHGISARTISFHEHNARSRVPQLIARLKAGQRVALVTDAGTPGISDPGQELVEACVREGIPVDPIPGANAHITAAIASGFPLDTITIMGFPPNKGRARTEWMERLESIENTVVFLEAPHRIVPTLEQAGHYLGERQIVVGRELTKAHQEFLRGTAVQVAGRLHAPRGEFTVVVSPKLRAGQAALSLSDEQIVREFGETTEKSALDRRSVIAAVAQKLGVPKKQVYAAVERAKLLVE